MKKRMGAFSAGLFLLLALTPSPPALAAQVSCEEWNTEAFFKRASAEDVSRCLKAGVNVNARETKFGLTPLHVAAAWSKTPGIVAALLDAGADTRAKDKTGKTGKTPWDYAKRNAAIKGTDVYQRLNEGRFK